MTEVVAVIMLLPVLAGLAALAGYFLLRRHLEVSRRHRAGVPVRWSVLPTPHARLHQRLRHVVAAVRAAVPSRRWRDDGSWLSEQADELEALAASCSRELVVSGHLDRRGRALARQRIWARIDQLEARAVELVELAAELDDRRLADGQWDGRADALRNRLVAMASAMDEVRLIDDDPLVAQSRAGSRTAPTAEPERATATAFPPR